MGREKRIMKVYLQEFINPGRSIKMPTAPAVSVIKGDKYKYVNTKKRFFFLTSIIFLTFQSDEK